MNLMSFFKKILELIKKLSRLFDRYVNEDGLDVPPSNNDKVKEKKESFDKKSFYDKYKLREPQNTTYKKKPIRPRNGKDMITIILIISSILFLSGCSKNQDVKIVHNYWGTNAWDKAPSYAEKKQQLHLDLYVYKKFKDINGKETISIYKAD